MRRLLGMTGLLLLALLGWYGWRYGQPRAAVYAFLRAENRSHSLQARSEYQRLDGSHVQVLYSDRDAAVAPLVLEAAEAVYGPVTDRLSLVPAEPVPVVVAPDRATLQREFGWTSADSALGVYQGGVVQILSPNVWLPGHDPAAQRRAFLRLNPLAHEITHYLLDYATQGNYPRWFTEGLAERVEYQVTGYLWRDAAGKVSQPLYTLADLADNFDNLPNQVLAYRQSYLLVDYLARTWGEAGLHGVIDRLGRQEPLDTALRQVTGLGEAEYAQHWTAWVHANAQSLDASLQG